MATSSFGKWRTNSPAPLARASCRSPGSPRISISIAPVVVVAPVKGERRIVEKALTHALGDVSLVQDLVRGSVAVDHPDDVRTVAERTLEVLRSRDVEIIEVEDHFGTAGAGGYRDFQINLRLPRSRVIGELQVHVKDLLLVKQRVGHGVYERARVACAALEMGIASTEISSTCSRNSGVMSGATTMPFEARIPARACAPGRVRRGRIVTL